MLQNKIISDGFEKNGLENFKLKNGLIITALKIAKNSNTFLGSVEDSNYLKIEDRFTSGEGGNKKLAGLHEYGIPITSLDYTDKQDRNSNNIQAITGIARERISYVSGGTNLFWHDADSVFFQDKYYRKRLPESSFWFDKPLYYFFQTQAGEANIELFKKLACVYRPEEYFKNTGINIAVSGRPILLKGQVLDLYQPLENGLTPAEHFYLERGDYQHLFKLLRLDYYEDERKEAFYLGLKELKEQKSIGIKYIREGLESISFGYDTGLFSREKIEKELASRYANTRYWLDDENGRVNFPQGLPKAAYPHNVLGVDIAGNTYLIQFHGKSASIGPTIEEMQSVLKDELGMYSALVTSNGLDVFLYDVRNSLYYSTSRSLEKVLAQKDRPSQHLMFVYEEE